jgi:hypothetical protein
MLRAALVVHSSIRNLRRNLTPWPPDERQLQTEEMFSCPESSGSSNGLPKRLRASALQRLLHHCGCRIYFSKTISLFAPASFLGVARDMNDHLVIICSKINSEIAQILALIVRCGHTVINFWPCFENKKLIFATWR